MQQNFDSDAYITETRRRWEDARERHSDLKRQYEQLNVDVGKAQRAVEAYRILLAELGIKPDEPPLAERAPPVVAAEPPMTTRREPMPLRQPKWANTTIRQAVVEVADEQPRHANDYARLIWVILSDPDLRAAKRTLNSELSRMAKDHILAKTGRNVFRKADNQTT